MKKRDVNAIVLYKLFLFTTIIFLFSCVNQEEDYHHFNEYKNNTESTISFSQIDSLNAINKKTIELSTYVSMKMRDSNKLQLILKIKRDLEKIDSELKKLTEKNLIIIPKPLYNLTINPDSLKDSDFYLLNSLKNQIENQIIVFDKIEKNTQNIDFKIFVIQSKNMVVENNTELKTLFSKN